MHQTRSATADEDARRLEWECRSHLKNGAYSGPPFAPSGWLDGDLLEGDVWNVLHSLLGVLHSNPADVTFSVDIKLRILVEVARLCDVGTAELDIERISVLEITNLHGRNERSKNALCTVSVSGRSITRKYRPSISMMGAQRRTRPSCWICSRTGCSTTRSIHSSRLWRDRDAGA